MERYSNETVLGAELSQTTHAMLQALETVLGPESVDTIKLDRVMHGNESEDWKAQALCAAVVDKRIFFPSRGQQLETAKRVCGLCAVKQECLDYALRHGEKFGIWGGLTDTQRRKLKTRAAS